MFLQYLKCPPVRNGQSDFTHLLYKDYVLKPVCKIALKKIYFLVSIVVTHSNPKENCFVISKYNIFARFTHWSNNINFVPDMLFHFSVILPFYARSQHPNIVYLRPSNNPTTCCSHYIIIIDYILLAYRKVTVSCWLHTSKTPLSFLSQHSASYKSDNHERHLLHNHSK